MTKRVREPIQVYLTPKERAKLDEAARELGVSRSETLRRGIEAVRRPQAAGVFRELVDEGLLTPPLTRRGSPPPSAPVTTLEMLMCELDADRAE
jgi:Ribbon-helix-helix protein, copG family